MKCFKLFVIDNLNTWVLSKAIFPFSGRYYYTVMAKTQQCVFASATIVYLMKLSFYKILL